MLNCKANVKLMDDADNPLVFGRQYFNSITLSPDKFHRAERISQQLLV